MNRFFITAAIGLALFTVLPAEADDIQTFNASGAFLSGSTLSGTITVDRTTGTANGNVLISSPDNFSYPISGGNYYSAAQALNFGGQQSSMPFDQISLLGVGTSLQTYSGSILYNVNQFSPTGYFSYVSNGTGGQDPLTSGTLSLAPTVDSNGVGHFNVAVTAGEQVYIDPTGATGFVYTESSGDPNFASVILPNEQTTPYTVSYSAGGMQQTVAVTPGATYTFSSPVSSFSVTGIDPSDDASVGNFVTGLTFDSAGTFSGTQSPINMTATPEPGTLPLLLVLAAGLAVSRAFRRSRSGRGVIFQGVVLQ